MSSGSQIVADVRGTVLHVLINRAEKRNALSRALLAEIGETFDHHAGNASIAAAVLTGAGDKCFAAGGDLRELDQLRSAADGRDMALGARKALDAIRSFPAPVIAALNGDALGGGAELAASCDFRIAAPHARIGFIQGKLGISTAWGGGIDLMAILGCSKALRLLATAQVLSSSEARELGLFDGVAETPAGLEAAVADFVRPMLDLRPQSLRAFKAVARACFDREAAEAAEVENFAACWGHADHWTAHDRVLNKQAAS